MADARDKSADDLDELSGSVENLRFRNEETGYVVCDVKPAESLSSTVTVVGMNSFI